jgi:hypothetical protein
MFSLLGERPKTGGNTVPEKSLSFKLTRMGHYLTKPMMHFLLDRKDDIYAGCQGEKT